MTWFLITALLVFCLPATFFTWFGLQGVFEYIKFRAMSEHSDFPYIARHEAIQAAIVAAVGFLFIALVYWDWIYLAPRLQPIFELMKTL